MRVDAALLLAAALIASPVSAIARNSKNEAAHTSSPPYAISNSSTIATHPSPKSSSKSTTSSLISSSHSSHVLDNLFHNNLNNTLNHPLNHNNIFRCAK
ncbi:hypothetical protein LMH87_006702 [Akanthomyces muscarius]|uniref:Uncharacterized protein n=1 Tax=Akanthomyces muscarius TaxID=2231603 RepID=A0A9W8UT30_AKAMU|nr:hypothetical protein LMH87_006702 [Akanthomyces muscarius]KAJ4165055.1 hypothetical protein LMH87_006702 [Akanthomyces muscarius]